MERHRQKRFREMLSHDSSKTASISEFTLDYSFLYAESSDGFFIFLISVRKIFGLFTVFGFVFLLMSSQRHHHEVSTGHTATLTLASVF